MDQRQLASVLFAVVGVFIAASRLPDIGFHIAVLAQSNPGYEGPSQQRMVAHLVLASALPILMGAALVFFRDRLANRLFPPGSQPLNAPEAQAVALSVLGCYLVVEGLSGVGWKGGINWGAATQLGLGVGLFLGARGVARLWSRERGVLSRGDQ